MLNQKNYHLWLLACGLWVFGANPAFSFSVSLSSSKFPVSDWEQVHGGSASSVTAKKYTDDFRQSLTAGIPRQSLGTRWWRKENIPPSLLAQRGVRGERFCSQQNLETLTTELLRNLPSYANRASQRARRLSRKNDAYSYVVVAGRPEFTPLPLNPSGYTTEETPKNASEDEDVKQVFFTTLEKVYTRGKAVQLQEFHWLFLTKTDSGWQMVMMFSQTGYYPANKPPTPPRDSSNGVIAQGVNTWLRDCRAASLR